MVFHCLLSVVHQLHPRNTGSLEVGRQAEGGTVEERRWEGKGRGLDTALATILLPPSPPHHDHPCAGLWFTKHLPLPVCVHSLTWPLWVEGLCEVHQSLTKSDIPHFPVDCLLFWMVVHDLQMLLRHGKKYVCCATTMLVTNRRGS